MDRRAEGSGADCAAGDSRSGEDAARGECGLKLYRYLERRKRECMASTADAGVVLELYQLRQETTLRAARKFMTSEFWPKDVAELRAVSRAQGSDKNAVWRQTMTDWGMAASLVLRG